MLEFTSNSNGAILAGFSASARIGLNDGYTPGIVFLWIGTDGGFDSVKYLSDVLAIGTDGTPTRSEAIRRLVELGLKAKK